MAILRKEGNGNQRRSSDPNALVRSEQQPELMRDPFDVIARDPFRFMREMMMDPFRMFQMSPYRDIGGEQRLQWNPSFEVRETDDAYIFKGDMPGVNQSDLDISLAGNNLQISGKRDREEERDEGTVHTYERSYGTFTRSFALPDAADLDKIKCDLKDGVLTLMVPKKPGSAPQRRKIQIGSGAKS